MASYTIAEAREQLDELLRKAAVGEEVVIARDGGRDVLLTPRRGGPVTAEDIEWLRRRRAKLADPVDLTQLIRDMRDEGP